MPKKRSSAKFTRPKKRAASSTPLRPHSTPKTSSQPRGRPRKGTTPTATTQKRTIPSRPSSPSSPSSSSSSGATRPATPRSDASSPAPRPQLIAAPATTTTRKRKRTASPALSSSSSNSTGSSQDELDHTRFPYLKPKERFIPHAQVKNRWTPLLAPAQDTLRTLFASIELPLIATQRDERKRIEAQMVLGAVTRTLGKRLPKMPFPPGTKENSFDYESVLRGNKELEQGVTPGLHSIALLKGEIRREQERLGTEKEELEGLRRNAKRQEKGTGKKLGKRHPLLERPADDELEDGADDIGFWRGEPDQSEDLDGDGLIESLEPITGQILSHLESIEGNADQVGGIKDQLEASTARLDAVLFEHLSKDSYDKLPVL